MSVADLERAFAAIETYRHALGLVGERGEVRVRAAEKTLGLTFPPTYRRFVLAYGAGNIGGTEICGVVKLDFEFSSAPDAIWATLRAREESDLPADLIVIGLDDYEITCLRVRPRDEEGPVIAIDRGDHAERAGARVVAPDFGTFLLGVVERELLSPTT